MVGNRTFREWQALSVRLDTPRPSRDASPRLCRRECFQNTAVGHRDISGTAVVYATQFGGKPFQVGDFSLDLFQVVRCNPVNFGAFLPCACGEAQKFADLV